MDYQTIYNDLEYIEQYIFREIDEDLRVEYIKLLLLNNNDLSYSDLINKYAKILYFWSNRMPDFSDIENGDIYCTFKWLYIQNRIIQLLRRIKKFDGSLLKVILSRYIMLLLT